MDGAFKILIAVCVTAVFAFGAGSAAKEAFDRGLAAHKQGNTQEAIAQFTQAIKLDPNYTDAYNNRGNAYYDLDDYDKAIADYAQAIKIDPGDADAYNNRGIAYHNLGDYDKAIADYAQAIKLDPNLAQATIIAGALTRI
jgi:tetratricopeptide (TPR) repeat protein